MVESEFTPNVSGVAGETKFESRYFISSLTLDAEKLYRVIRGQWGMEENGLRWILDNVFMEDKYRIRRGIGPSFWSAMRKIAVNVLKLFPGKEYLGDK